MTRISFGSAELPIVPTELCACFVPLFYGIQSKAPSSGSKHEKEQGSGGQQPNETSPLCFLLASELCPVGVGIKAQENLFEVFGEGGA